MDFAMADSFHTPPYTERRMGNLELQHIQRLHQEDINESRRIRERALEIELLYLAFSAEQTFFFPLPLQVRRILHRFVAPEAYGAAPPPSPSSTPSTSTKMVGQDLPCPFLNCTSWVRVHRELRSAFQCKRCQLVQKCCDAHRRTYTPVFMTCRRCSAGSHCLVAYPPSTARRALYD